MSLLSEGATRFGGAQAKTRRPVSWAEECMRNGVELFFRERFPAARIVHELVMDRGSVRADVCAIGTDHIAAAEIKSEYDGSDRLINQIAMFRLATPELWLFVAHRHVRDAEIMAYLMPSLGYAIADEIETKKAFNEGRVPAFSIKREATLFRPDPEALLSLLWVSELTCEAVTHRLITPSKKPAAHAWLVRLCVEKLTEAEAMAAVCRQLRARETEWRADPAVGCVIVSTNPHGPVPPSPMFDGEGA